MSKNKFFKLLFITLLSFSLPITILPFLPLQVPQVKAQTQTKVFGNPSLPDWRNISVIIATDNKSFTIDNADNLTFTFWYGANKYDSIYQSGVQIVKDELWMLQFYDGSWKDVGSSVNIFYEQVTSYNARVIQAYTSANGNYNVTWDFYGGFRPKISLSANLSVVGNYRIDWRTNIYKDYAENMTNYVKFWNSVEEAVVFDYSDVYEVFGNITSVEGVEGWVKGKRFDLVFNVGVLSVGVFRLDPNFGYETLGASGWGLGDYIAGSVFTLTEAGTADSITAGLRYFAQSFTGKLKCAIYLHSDLSLVKATVERTIALTSTPTWYTFNFAAPKPSLIANTEYVLVVWAQSLGTSDPQVVYNAGGINQGHYDPVTYNGFPDPLVPTHQDNKYSIYCTYTITNAPTIGEFQAPTTVYANKYFLLNETINDADGIAGFDYSTIEINGSVILKWVNTTAETYHFSEYSDTNGYCTLDVANSAQSTVNTTAYKLSWKIKLNWTYPEGSVNIVVTNTKVFDSTGASGSDSYTGLFTFEDDLIIHTDAAVSDSRVNPSQSITFTATIYYQGTTTAPEDVTGITGRVELAGVLKGSDTDVAGGLSITVNAETSFVQHAYNIYAYTDQASVTNQTVNVIVDRGVITISANTTSPAPNAYVNFTVTAIYDYDDTSITSWTVNTYRNSTHFATGNFTDGGYTDLFYIYTAENMTETAYGLTSFTSNTATVYWSTYIALTVKTVDLDSTILTDAIVDFNGTEVTVDSNGLATKTGIVKYNNMTVKVKWQGCWVNGSWTVNMTETKTIEANCNVWQITVNVRDNGGTMLSLTPSKFVWNFPNGTQVNTTKTDGSWIFKLMNGTHYYQIEYQGQWVSENVTLPVTNKNVTAINKNCWVYQLTTYVTDVNNLEKSGAALALTRTDGHNYATAGLSPVTAGYYNTTHAKYVWSQLANQTSSYTVTASLGGQSASATASLTANTEALITLPAGTSSGGGGGGGVAPPVVQPPAWVTPVVLPTVPGAEFNYGIAILVGVVGVAVVVGVAGRSKPTLETQWKRKTKLAGGLSGKWKKTKRVDLSRKWMKKTRRR